MSDSEVYVTAQEVSFMLLCFTAYGMMFFAPLTLYVLGDVKGAGEMAESFVQIWVILFFLIMIRHGVLYWGWAEPFKELYERYVQ